MVTPRDLWRQRPSEGVGVSGHGMAAGDLRAAGTAGQLQSLHRCPRDAPPKGQHLPSVNWQDLPPGQAQACVPGTWANKSNTGLSTNSSPFLCPCAHSLAMVKVRHGSRARSCPGEAPSPWAPLGATAREGASKCTPVAGVGLGNRQGWPEQAGLREGEFTPSLGPQAVPGDPECEKQNKSDNREVEGPKPSKGAQSACGRVGGEGRWMTAQSG